MLTHDIRCVFLKRTVLEVVDFLWFWVLEGRGPLVQRWCCAGWRRPVPKGSKGIYNIGLYTWPPRKKSYHYMMFVPCKLVCLTTLNGMISLNLLSSWKNKHQLHHQIFCFNVAGAPQGQSTGKVRTPLWVLFVHLDSSNGIHWNWFIFPDCGPCLGAVPNTCVNMYWTS